GASVVAMQSNIEGELVNILQQTDADAVVINAGAYSHYSIALRDCIEDMSVPVVELHMTDIYAREEFRHVDVLADVCTALFYGKGVQSYLDAVDFLTK
ncbi:MAG: 3-dehydroquinate dehydratase, partial [Clostridia bacterium]|nr:3-dehydroquinate dehydratase [Clostridia bacterium]